MLFLTPFSFVLNVLHYHMPPARKWTALDNQLKTLLDVKLDMKCSRVGDRIIVI